MTYLSQLHLSLQRNDVQRDTQDCCLLHRRLLSAFPQTTEAAARSAFGILYCVESNGTILVQSQIEPSAVPTVEPMWAQLPPGYARVQAKEIIGTVVMGQFIRFRLRAVASKCVSQGKGRRGKRISLTQPDEVHAWMIRAAAAAGLVLQSVQTTKERAIRGRHRAGDQIVAYPHLFNGLAQVIDPVAVEQARIVGIGPEKAYGCGLLSLAPVGEDEL